TSYAGMVCCCRRGVRCDQERRRTMRKEIVAVVGAGLVAAGAAWAGAARTGEAKQRPGQGHRLDADRIGAAAGTKATTTKDGVVRIGWPRTDVKVTVDGMPLKPFAGLGSWAAFTP